MSKPTRYESNRKRPAHTSKWISLCFDTLFLCLYFHIIWTDFKLSFMTLCLQICHFPIILRSLPIPPQLFTFSTPASYLRLFHLNENIAAKSRKKTVEKRPSPPWKRQCIFSSASMLWRRMGNVRRNRGKGVLPICKVALLNVSRKFGSAWERYNFSQTLYDVHSCLKSEIIFTLRNSLLSGWG